MRFAFFLVVLVLVYWPALHGSFLWDDGGHVPSSPEFYTWAGLRSIWTEKAFTQQYYPLTFTSIWLAHHLWGMSPVGYHVLTLSFHALSAPLLWGLLELMSVSAAGWIAAAWALHPMQVESVAWISEIKNTLSGFFYLAALGVAWHFWQRERPARALYAFAFLLYLAAVFSKTVSCTFPVVFGILLWWKRGRLQARDLFYLLPFVAVGIWVGLRTASWEKFYFGAIGPDWDFTVADRFRIAGRAFCFYIEKWLWPKPVIFMYPRWTPASIHTGGSVALAAVAVTGGTLWALRGRIGRGALAGFLIYGVVIGPALGFFDLYPMRFSFVANHFQYLASIAVAVLVITFWRRVAIKLDASLRFRRAGAFLGCSALAFMSWRQAHAFVSSETLWRQTLKDNPHSYAAKMNLATELRFSGRQREGWELLKSAKPEKPNDLQVQVAEADWWLNEFHDARPAVGLLQQAAQTVDALPPSHIKDYLLFTMAHALGQAYYASGNEREAKASYAVALTRIGPLEHHHYYDAPGEWLDRGQADIRDHLARLAVKHGQLDEAVAQLTAIVQLFPNSHGPWMHLAEVLQRQGKIAASTAAFREAARHPTSSNLER